ncbi:MAG: glutaredoxin 3 [Proteobacteria bacterium]|nr:glutaredoxin 3 [Pseudomonadota bacterium]
MLPKHPKQAEILFYTKDYCPYCVAAKNLLNQKGVAYTEIDVTHDSVKYQEMLTKASPRRTVPQIFINGSGVGGFDDIKALDTKGELEKLLFPSGR